MRRILWSFCISLSMFPVVVMADEVDIGALLETQSQRQSSTSYKLEYAYASELKQAQKFELNVIHNERWKLSDQTELIAIGRLHTDAYRNLEPDNPGQLEVAPISRRAIIDNFFDLELREFYLKKTIGESLLQIGKQQVVWGNADGLRVLDVVDPFSYREFILSENEDARIPRWKINYQIPAGTANLQLLWIPDNSYNDFADAGSSYAITSPRYMPQSVPGVTVIQPPTYHPYNFFPDSDYGFRLAGSIGSWDVSAVYLYHYDPIPVFFRTAQLTTLGPVVNVNARYERSSLIGGTFSNAFGSTVVRGELGYNKDRYFLTTDLGSGEGVLKTNELSYVLGLDFSQIQYSLISVQIFQSRLADTVPTLTREKIDTTCSFLVNRTFLNEKWLVELQWIQSVNENDGVVRPKLTYKGIDNFNFWIGTDVFFGNQIGTFGQFDNQDRIFIGMKWYQ